MNILYFNHVVLLARLHQVYTTVQKPLLKEILSHLK